MEIKIIPGETEASFMIRCTKQEIDLTGKTEREVAPICYHEWRVQNMEEIKSIKDKELAIKKYHHFISGVNLKID